MATMWGWPTPPVGRSAPRPTNQPPRRNVSVDILPPATHHGVPRMVICSEGYRRLQELNGKRWETMIYTGSARRKVTAPYVQSGVDNILRPALSCPLNLYRDLEVRLCLCSGLVCRLCV